MDLINLHEKSLSFMQFGISDTPSIHIKKKVRLDTRLIMNIYNKPPCGDPNVIKR